MSDPVNMPGRDHATTHKTAPWITELAHRMEDIWWNRSIQPRDDDHYISLKYRQMAALAALTVMIRMRRMRLSDDEFSHILAETRAELPLINDLVVARTQLALALMNPPPEVFVDVGTYHNWVQSIARKLS